MTTEIIAGDAVEVLKEKESDTFDMAIFSPPYDGLRDFDGHSFNIHNLGIELYRVMKHGSVAVVVLQDQTVNGHKTLTTFRTIMDWCDNIGFGLWECVIYNRLGKPGPWWAKRFRVDHEYMPVFIKGRHTSINRHYKFHVSIQAKR